MYAVCPGGEVADLKSVELKGFAGSNPVCSDEEELRWLKHSSDTRKTESPSLSSSIS